jgi:cephalosporin hydroxylase
VGREFARVYYESMDRTWKRTFWTGVKVQKLPLDLWTLQEIVVETRPDFLVETGTRFGGSALFFAHLFDILGSGQVLTIDVEAAQMDPRALTHPRVTLIEGSSTDSEVVASVREVTSGGRVMVTLDSDHSMDHVMNELEAFAPLVAPGCYLIVEDTNLNGNPINPGFGPGPAEALAEWLPSNPSFVVDPEAEKFMATFFPGGFLRRVDDGQAAPGAPADEHTTGTGGQGPRGEHPPGAVRGAVDEHALLDRQRLALEEALRDARKAARQADRGRERAVAKRKRAEKKRRRMKAKRDELKARLRAVEASPRERALGVLRALRTAPGRAVLAVSRRRR